MKSIISKVAAFALVAILATACCGNGNSKCGAKDGAQKACTKGGGCACGEGCACASGECPKECLCGENCTCTKGECAKGACACGTACACAEGCCKDGACGKDGACCKDGSCGAECCKDGVCTKGCCKEGVCGKGCCKGTKAHAVYNPNQMPDMKTLPLFFESDKAEVIKVNDRVTRKQTCLNDLMTTIVEIKGPMDKADPTHQHPAEQISYIAEGDVIVTIGSESKKLKQGDIFAVPANTPHTVQALGPKLVLIDTFNPVREDFLKK